MRQAVTLALQNSRDLALARVQYTVALNEAGLDRSAFLPNLYTGSGAAYTSGFPSIAGGPPAVFQMSYNEAVFNPLLEGPATRRGRPREKYETRDRSNA